MAEWNYGTYVDRDLAYWAMTGIQGVYAYPSGDPGTANITMYTIPHLRGTGYDPVSALGTDWTAGSSTATNDVEYLFKNLPETEITGGTLTYNLAFTITGIPVEEGDRFRIPVGALTLEMIDGTNYPGGPPVKCSPYLFGRFIEYLFGMEPLPTEERYLGLHDSEVEIAGGGYARYHLVGGTYASFDGRQLAFYDVPTATIDGWGIYDAPTGGNLLLYGSYEQAQNAVAGDAFLHRINAATSFTVLDVL